MLNQWWLRRGRWLWLAPGGLLLTLGGCPLSDLQLTSVYQGVLATALDTLVQTFITGLSGGTTG